MLDLNLVLAIAHHLAVFTLVAIFAAEFALLRPGIEGKRLTQLSKIDGAYGAVAGLVVVVGNFSGVSRGRAIMGMEWASRDGLREAIPPAYTHFIGAQLIDALAVTP